MDLTEAFNYITIDLLIAKLHAYGFSEKTPPYFISYLKYHKQNVKTFDIYNRFETLLSDVWPGSVLGPIMFNRFLNDLPSFKRRQTLLTLNMLQLSW